MAQIDEPARTTGRIAVVVGGSGGIGRAVVERLASDAVTVVVHFSGRQGRADEIVDAVRAGGGSALAAGGDVADEHAMAALVDRVEREFGGVDVVVNTAGLMLLAPMLELDLADLDRMHRVNIRGTFVVSLLESS